MPAGKRTSPKRRWWLAAAVAVVVAAGVAGVLLRAPDDDTATAASGSATQTSAGTTAVAAPTTEVYSDPRAPGTTPVSTEPPADVATDEPRTVPDGQADVTVTFAGWDDATSSVEVDAFVGSLIEDGGSCTLTLTRGTDNRTASSAATADASTTICAPLRVSDAQLTSGTWQAVVAYSSATARGTSAPVRVTVP
ncbi:hypothetical protein [Geodermatophilus sp. URMC 64]